MTREEIAERLEARAILHSEAAARRDYDGNYFVTQETHAAIADELHAAAAELRRPLDFEWRGQSLYLMGLRIGDVFRDGRTWRYGLRAGSWLGRGKTEAEARSGLEASITAQIMGEEDAPSR